MGLVFATAFDRRYLMGILVLPIVAFVPGIAERLGDLGNGAEFQYNSFDQLNSYAWRMYLWENAIMWLRAHPAGLLGHGLESFRTYSSVFFPLALEGGAPAHNAYLQIYFETGALGLTGFAVLFAALVRQLIRGTVRDRQGAGIALALVAGYLVVCYSDNVLDYLAFNWQFWFTLGSMLGVLRIQGPNPRARAVGVGRSELANAPGVGTLA
jgi:O-antigen ligase